MINTLNESSLHRTLKTYYASMSEGSRTEVKTDDYIADIIDKKGNITEIQTANLAYLKDKIKYFTAEKRNISVIYPIVTTKYIETVNQKTGKTVYRKSPQHKTIYSIFRELTGLYPFLLNKYFSLEAVEVITVEIRKTTEEPVQSINGRRRVRRNWLKTDKQLKEIGKIHKFHSREHYLSLLPKNLPECFTATDIRKAFAEQNLKIKTNDIQLMLWVFSHCGLLEKKECGKRRYNYRIK